MARIKVSVETRHFGRIQACAAHLDLKPDCRWRPTRCDLEWTFQHTRMNAPLPATHRLDARDRRIRRVAWGASSLLHSLFVAGLVFGQPLLWLLLGPPLVPPRRTIEVVARMDLREPASLDPLLEYAIDQGPAPRRIPRPASGEDSPATNSPTPGLLDPDRDQSPKTADPLSPDAIVQRRVKRAIDDARQLDSRQQLDRLGELSGELNKVSTEESLDQLTTQLQGFLGLKPRATRPTEQPAAGPFDMSTAQIHDVRRVELKEGGFKYLAILLDSAGRQMETEIDEETGEQLHRTFELIKTNPLLEKVYRQVVMSLLDKIIQPAGVESPGKQSLPPAATPPAQPPPPANTPPLPPTPSPSSTPGAPSAPLVPPGPSADNTR